MRAHLFAFDLERLDGRIADQLGRRIDAAETFSIIGVDVPPFDRNKRDSAFGLEMPGRNVGRIARGEIVRHVVVELVEAFGTCELQPWNRLPLNLRVGTYVCFCITDTLGERAVDDPGRRGSLERIDKVGTPLSTHENLPTGVVAGLRVHTLRTRPPTV